MNDLTVEIDELFDGVVSSATKAAIRACGRMRRLQALVYEQVPTEVQPNGVTWKEAAEQLRADNAVLAAEVRAWRGLAEACETVGGDTRGADARLTEAQAKTDASGALEREVRDV